MAQTLWAACVVEAAARKPGNVHPDASFSDATFAHFVAAATCAAPILAQAADRGVGRVICDATRDARRATGTNTNLGVVLLLAPLAAVPEGVTLSEGIPGVLAGLTWEDAHHVYDAIREAQPGGLGRTRSGDVCNPPEAPLQEAMRMAAERDLVARQYACGFRDVLEFALPQLRSSWPARFDCDRHSKTAPAGEGNPQGWELAIIDLQLRLLARHGDSLIARKCGDEISMQAAAWARGVLESGWPNQAGSIQALAGFDAWLRAEGNRRNPGATADLVAAALFALFREFPETIPDKKALAMLASTWRE